MGIPQFDQPKGKNMSNVEAKQRVCRCDETEPKPACPVHGRGAEERHAMGEDRTPDSDGFIIRYGPLDAARVIAERRARRWKGLRG